MGFYYVSNELYHHGVKGMKWGVRKVDTSTNAMRSTDALRKTQDLEWQESRAHSDNRKGYRAYKKSLKTNLKAKKMTKEITKAEYKAKKKEGINAAKQVFRNNNEKIRKDFNRAYYEQISAGELAAARTRQSTAYLLGNTYENYEANKATLSRAEARRNEYMQDYMMRNYKPKK